MSTVSTGPLVRRVAAGATVLALSVFGILIAPMSASAATFTVTSLADDGSAGTLRFEVLAANASPGPDTVNVAVPGSIVLTSTITITEGVVINGSGVGSSEVTRNGNFELFQIDVLSVDQDVTFDGIHFDGAGSGVSDQRAIRVFNTIPPRDLTISDSEFDAFETTVLGSVLFLGQLTGDFLFDGTDAHDNVAISGGAIVVDGVAGDVQFSNSSIYDNVGESGGGISITNSGAVTISDVDFTDNVTSNAGGAAYLSANASVLVSGGSTFETNESTGNSGGAIHMSGPGGLTVEDATFTGNRAAIHGGAVNLVFVDGVTVTSTVFTNNSANGFGGGINLQNPGVVDISESGFTGNSAFFGGGMHFEALNGSVDLDTNVFRDNFAGLNGGGVSIRDVTEAVTVSNSTFVLNEAADTGGSSGGGLWVENVVTGPFLVESSTFTQNVAGNAGVSIGIDSVIGGGLAGVANSTFFEEDPNPYAINVGNAAAGSTLLIVSDTIVGNGAVHVGNVDGTVGISNSIIDGEVNGPLWPAVVRDSGSGLIFVEWSIVTSPILLTSMNGLTGNQFSTDPQLGALAFNGGLTNTMLPAAGSPAIDAGDPAYPFGFTSDQRGSARIAQGRVDIGAVELQALADTGLELNPLVPMSAVLVLLAGVALVLRRRRTA